MKKTSFQVIFKIVAVLLVSAGLLFITGSFLMSLGILILLVVFEYGVLDRIEKRRILRDHEERLRQILNDDDDKKQA